MYKFPPPDIFSPEQSKQADSSFPQLYLHVRLLKELMSLCTKTCGQTVSTLLAACSLFSNYFLSARRNDTTVQSNTMLDRNKCYIIYTVNHTVWYVLYINFVFICMSLCFFVLLQAVNNSKTMTAYPQSVMHLSHSSMCQSSSLRSTPRAETPAQNPCGLLAVHHKSPLIRF